MSSGLFCNASSPHSYYLSPNRPSFCLLCTSQLNLMHALLFPSLTSPFFFHHHTHTFSIAYLGHSGNKNSFLQPPSLCSLEPRVSQRWLWANMETIVLIMTPSLWGTKPDSATSPRCSLETWSRMHLLVQRSCSKSTCGLLITLCIMWWLAL